MRSEFEFVYIANDGTKFFDKEICEAYEASLPAKSPMERLNEIPQFTLEPELFALDDEYTWEWYYLRSDDDLTTLREALYCADAIADTDSGIESFPCWVVAHVTGDGYGVISPYELIEEGLLRFIKRFAILRERAVPNNSSGDREGVDK